MCTVHPLILRGSDCPLGRVFPWASCELAFLAQQQVNEVRAPELPSAPQPENTKLFMSGRIPFAVPHPALLRSICGNQDNSTPAAEGNRLYLKSQDRSFSSARLSLAAELL